jgi:biotin transport system substrate-specific component
MQVFACARPDFVDSTIPPKPTLSRMLTLQLSSPRTATVDRLRSARATLATQVAGIAGFALLAGLLAQFEIRVYMWEVPITLQTLAIYGSGLFLGWRNGLLAMALYLALGLVMPFFAGGASGTAHLFAASTSGYLLGAPLAAAVIGLASTRWNSLTGSMLATVLGSAVLFTCGVVWLHFFAGHETWLESLDKGWLRFVIWDLAKIVMVGVLYTGFRRLK